MERFKGSKGKVSNFTEEIENTGCTTTKIIVQKNPSPSSMYIVAKVLGTQKAENFHNAILVKDTFETIQNSDLLPSEVLDRYNELVELSNMVINEFKTGDKVSDRLADSITALNSKIKYHKK